MSGEISFGAWLPDFPDYKNPGCVMARNVIPIPGGYGPHPGLLATGQSSAGAIRSAQLMFKGDGTDVIVGSTGITLFKNDAGTVTVTGGYQSSGPNDGWDFCQFNDFVIATNINNFPQYLTDIDTDSEWSTLPGQAPRARWCERVGDFVVFGNIDTKPTRIQWSSFNSPATAWAPNRLTQAGYVDLARALGAVQRIVGGRYPMVMQERGIQRLEYIGPPSIWRVTEIESARGVLAPRSVVTVGFLTFYLAQDGFYVTDGNSAQPIGSSKVNRWFIENVNPAEIRNTRGALDFQNACVVWAFKTGAVYDRLIRYSWAEERWTVAHVETGALVECVPDGMTLEQIGAAYAALEDVPASLDDARWQGQGRALACYLDIGANTELHTFTGELLRAYLETGEFQPRPGRRVHINKGKVLGQGGLNWQVAPILIQADGSESQKPLTSPQSAGWAPLRGDALSMRMCARALPGTPWRTVTGLQLDTRVSGGR